MLYVYGAILWMGIPRNVFGTSIPTLVELGFDQIHIPAQEVAARHSLTECEVVAGVGNNETDQLFVQASRRRVQSRR